MMPGYLMDLRIAQRSFETSCITPAAGRNEATNHAGTEASVRFEPV